MDSVRLTTAQALVKWMLAQPAFRTAAFHTAYLDEVLQQRQGEPFDLADKEDEDVAAVVAALHMAARPRPLARGTSLVRLVNANLTRFAPHGDDARSWKDQGRIEALRS